MLALFLGDGDTSGLLSTLLVPFTCDWTGHDGYDTGFPVEVPMIAAERVVGHGGVTFSRVLFVTGGASLDVGGRLLFLFVAVDDVIGLILITAGYDLALQFVF